MCNHTHTQGTILRESKRRKYSRKREKEMSAASERRGRKHGEKECEKGLTSNREDRERGDKVRGGGSVEDREGGESRTDGESNTEFIFGLSHGWWAVLIDRGKEKNYNLLNLSSITLHISFLHAAKIMELQYKMPIHHSICAGFMCLSPRRSSTDKHFVYPIVFWPPPFGVYITSEPGRREEGLVLHYQHI